MTLSLILKAQNMSTVVFIPRAKEMAKTFNSGYSLVVTHLTTNPPVRCLNRAERTGSLVFNVLWSNVKITRNYLYIFQFMCGI
jgi:hypothetical protein